MAKSRAKVLSHPISMQRNDKFLSESYKNIRKNLGEISRILLKMSGEIREYCFEILVATLGLV